MVQMACMAQLTLALLKKLVGCFVFSHTLRSVECRSALKHRRIARNVPHFTVNCIDDRLCVLPAHDCLDPSVQPAPPRPVRHQHAPTLITTAADRRWTSLFAEKMPGRALGRGVPISEELSNPTNVPDQSDDADTRARTRVLQDLLKIAIWSFFAERLLQSTLVGWGQSGRVGPVEQLGGTLIEADSPDQARWLETRAILQGVRLSADVIHLNTEQASPEMFAKVDCTELMCASSACRDGSCEDEESREDSEDVVKEEPLLFFEYAAPAFAHLRGVYGLSSSEYRRSFRENSRMIALAANSKSAQSFMFSGDGMYMLKTASESELESMLRFLPHYADHVSRRRGSLITRFHGIYRVTNPRTRRSTVFVVSSNVFSTEKRLQARYDLKGSIVGRRATSPDSGVIKPTTMMKDLDLSEGKGKVDGGKVLLARGCKRRLMQELRADADFLTKLGLMDYSLLVGIHRRVKPQRSSLKIPLAVLSVASKPIWTVGCFLAGCLPGVARRGGRRPQIGVYPGREPGEVYYVGIIDVLQRYNLRKILERRAKGVVYNMHEISSVPPEEYRDRFLDFIDKSTE